MRVNDLHPNFRNSRLFCSLCVCFYTLCVTCEKCLSFLHYSHMSAVPDRLVSPHAAMPTVSASLSASLFLSVSLTLHHSLSLSCCSQLSCSIWLRDRWQQVCVGMLCSVSSTNCEIFLTFVMFIYKPDVIYAGTQTQICTLVQCNVNVLSCFTVHTYYTFLHYCGRNTPDGVSLKCLCFWMCHLR